MAEIHLKLNVSALSTTFSSKKEEEKEEEDKQTNKTNHRFDDLFMSRLDKDTQTRQRVHTYLSCVITFDRD